MTGSASRSDVTRGDAPGRAGQYADNILKGFSGILQVDGYAGYNRLLKRPTQNVVLAYCWAHARRKLHDVTQSGAAPIAQEGLAQIQALYRIEKDLRGLSADQRHAARQERSKSIIDAFEIWLAQSRTRVSAKSPTGEALKSALIDTAYRLPRSASPNTGKGYAGSSTTVASSSTTIPSSARSAPLPSTAKMHSSQVMTQAHKTGPSSRP